MVPAVEVPGSPEQGTESDDGDGEGQVGIDAVAAALGAAAQLAEVVEPGVGPLDDPAPADLDRRRLPAMGDLAVQAALVEGLPAGPVVIAGVQMHGDLG